MAPQTRNHFLPTVNKTPGSEESGTTKARPSDVKLRRPHRKSRNGCLECKKRHVKCDETRPTCVHCATTARRCYYADPPPLASARPPVSASQILTTCNTPTSSNNSDEVVNAVAGTRDSIATLVDQFTTRNDCSRIGSRTPSNHFFTMEHMRLLHHLETSMDAILAVDELVKPMTDQTLEAALQNPYLLDVLLGLSAQHLAVLYPSQADYYHHQATQLQTRGLSRFNQARDDISGEKSIPMFLFASTLGHQLLCDSLRSCRDDFDSYLGQFAWYLEIHRGVSTVTNCSWKTIRESGVKTFVQFLEAAKPTTEAPEIDTLHCMLDQSNLSPVSLQACRQATETLRNSFRIYRSILKRSIHTSASVTSFGACVTTDFIDVLKQRRPEALVILAFYAVLLHWCRNFWIFSDAGQFMIRSIAARLGDGWLKWLAFPLSVLELEQTS